MSTTFFNTKKSNIEKLTKKSKKNKDNIENYTSDKNTDKPVNNENENENDKDISKKDDIDDDKVVESFVMFGSMSGGDDESNNSANKSKSNIFSSSDDDKINATSSTGKQSSNTAKAAGEQLDPDRYIVFILHALLCVLFTYAWGFLATNVLYLSSEPTNNIDYILPIKEYSIPYTDNPKSKKCWYEYGFPYNLSSRDVNQNTDITRIMQKQKDTTYYLWLSKTTIENDKSGIYQASFSGALYQYLFEATYGGLAKGGRSLIRILIGITGYQGIKPDENDKDENDKDNNDKDKNDKDKNDKCTWDKIKDNTFKKMVTFIVWPFIIMNFLIPAVSMWSGAATFLFGILQNHIFWGLIFSFTIGMFVAMANGIYMGIQTFYIFFLYPLLTTDSRPQGSKWFDIFNDLKTYMLFAFYIMICFYGYEDLGPAGGAGIMFIVVVSIILYYLKNSD
jgi:hypothetical protein